MDATPGPPPAPAPTPAPAPVEPEAPQQRSWAPWKTPLAYLFLAAQLGFYALAAQKSGDWGLPSGKWLAQYGQLLVHAIHVEPWRLVTCLFVEPMGLQLFLNAILMWSAGPELERIYGKVRFAALYLGGGLGALLACEILHVYFPEVGIQGTEGCGARHAVFVLAGALPGLILAARGFVAMLTSGAVWSQVAWIVGVVVLSYLLQSRGTPVGIDRGRWLIDLGFGFVLGTALGLTLYRGGWKLGLGIALTVVYALLLAGAYGRLAVRSWQIAQGRQGFPNASANAGPTLTPGRMPEEAAIPRRPSVPADEDPSEVVAMRKRAAKVLDKVGALPEPDPSLATEARRIAEELEHFDERWTSSAHSGLDTEMAELHLVARDLSKAEGFADAGRHSFEGMSPARGSPRARLIARCYGVLAQVALARKEPDEVAAQALLEKAVSWDALLPEAHFYLGKLANDPKRREDELKLFLTQVGPSPRVARQRELALEARRLLGQ